MTKQPNFNITIWTISDERGWLVTCTTLGSVVGAGDTIFEALEDWARKVKMDVANEFVCRKMGI